MQRLNFKQNRYLFLAIALVLIVVICLIIFGRKTSLETSSRNDLEKQILSQNQISQIARGQLAGYFNPFSTDDLTYLAPSDDTTKANVGKSLQDAQLLVTKFSTQTGKTSKSDKPVILKPKKVIWGHDNSLFYLSQDKSAHLVILDSGADRKLSSDSVDLAFYDLNHMASYLDSASLEIFDPKTGGKVVSISNALNSPNSTVATGEGIVYINKASDLTFYQNASGKSAGLGVSADHVSAYAFGKYILVQKDDKSFFLDTNTKARIDLGTGVDLDLIAKAKDSFIFGLKKSGQAEDSTALKCLETQTGKIVDIYNPTDPEASFDTSSIAIVNDNLFFTWSDILYQKKLTGDNWQKCLNGK